MSTVSKISSYSSFPVNVDEKTCHELKEDLFQKKFRAPFTETIDLDNGSKVDHIPITSFEMKEAMTLFALEMKNQNIHAILGWHLQKGASIEHIKVKIGELASSSQSYEFILIGGNDESAGLHTNIYQALEQFFPEKPRIKLELVNLKRQKPYVSLSASLDIDGQLSYCFHEKA